MPEIKLVGLDGDGTLFKGSNEVLRAGYEEVLADEGAVFLPGAMGDLLDRSLAENWGSSPERQLRKMLGDLLDRDPEILDRTLQRWNSYVATGLIKNIEAIPGSLATLTRIKKVGGKMLALNTATPKEILSQIVMPRVGYPIELFNLIVTAGELEKEGREPKPAGDSLEKIMDAAEVTPEEVIYVGDDRVDVEAAQSAGIKNMVVVLTGNLAVRRARDLGVRDENIIPDVGHLEIVIDRIEER